MRRFNLLRDELEAEDEWYRPGYPKRAAAVDEAIGATKIGGAVYELEEGERVCPYHYHHGVEEWLLVIEGAPTLRGPDGERVMRPGDVVCFPSGETGAHEVRGPGRFLLVSAAQPTSVNVYPDSGKVGTRPATGDDRLDFRRADAVGYWYGER